MFIVANIMHKISKLYTGEYYVQDKFKNLEDVHNP